MKIALINSVYKRGSTGRICYEMEEFFNQHGHETIVFYGRGKKDHKNIKFPLPLSVPLHGFLSRIFDNSGFNSKFSTQKLIGLLKRFSPDVVVLHNLHGYYLDIKLLLSFFQSNNIKIILVTHDCWLFTGHCSHFSAAKCDKWMSCCYHCANKSKYPKSLFFDNSKRNFLTKKNLFYKLDNIHIVSPSIWMLNNLKKSFLQNKALHLIRNGVDIVSFRKTNSDIRKKYNICKKKILLFVSYIWTVEKGLNDIYKIAEILREDEILLVVGQHKAQPKKHKNIIFVNSRVPLDSLVQFYSAADIFINLTYEDTSSQVNCEALCCELPVITYKTCGAHEMVDPKFVVEQGDVESILKLSRKIFQGEKYVFPEKSTFSKETCYRQYLELITKI